MTTLHQRLAIGGSLAIVAGFVWLAVAWSSPVYLLCGGVVLVGAVLATVHTRR